MSDFPGTTVPEGMLASFFSRPMHDVTSPLLNARSSGTKNVRELRSEGRYAGPSNTNALERRLIMGIDPIEADDEHDASRLIYAAMPVGYPRQMLRLWGKALPEGGVAKLSAPLTGRTAGYVLHQAEFVEVARLVLEDAKEEAVAAPYERALNEFRADLAQEHARALRLFIQRRLSDPEDLAELDARPSAISFNQMLAFLAAHKWTKTPNPSLGRNGTFGLTWIAQQNGKIQVDLIFLADGGIKWFAHDGRNSAQKPRSGAGTEDPQGIARILTAYEFDTWAAIELKAWAAA